MFSFCVFPQPVIYHACETANAIPEGTQSPLVQRPKIFQLMDILCLFCSFMVNIRDTETWEGGIQEMTWGGCWAGPGSPEVPTTWPSYSVDPTVRPKENRGSTSRSAQAASYLSQVRRGTELLPAGCRGRGWVRTVMLSVCKQQQQS